ncbi:hypothetical protein BREVNS_0826 [Brevinematales bacterium NS]|nr:hypothetical protein BREVNS_0826 [Brevinematales bacterium NS]
MAYRGFVLVCGGTGCESNKAGVIFDAMKKKDDRTGASERDSACKNRLFWSL